MMNTPWCDAKCLRRSFRNIELWHPSMEYVHGTVTFSHNKMWSSFLQPWNISPHLLGHSINSHASSFFSSFQKIWHSLFIHYRPKYFILIIYESLIELTQVTCTCILCETNKSGSVYEDLRNLQTHCYYKYCLFLSNRFVEWRFDSISDIVTALYLCNLRQFRCCWCLWYYYEVLNFW